MTKILRMFSPPKVDRTAVAAQEAALAEQRAALADQQRLAAERESETKALEDAAKRARDRARAGRASLLNDEIGIVPATAAPGTAQKLGG